jgi:hypothetical protein
MAVTRHAAPKNSRPPVRNWIDDPHPFVWVKTADEILDTLAANCARTSYSEH